MIELCIFFENEFKPVKGFAFGNVQAEDIEDEEDDDDENEEIEEDEEMEVENENQANIAQPVRFSSQLIS